MRSVCAHRSSPGTLFCGMPRCASRSGNRVARTPGVGQEPQPHRRPTGEEQPVQLPEIRSPDRWAVERRVLPDRGQGRRLELEAERGREPDPAEDPQRILPEPRGRVADGADQTGADVGHPVVRVHESPGRWRRPPAAPHAMAFIVKSRRARSTSMVPPNTIRCGRRKSA